MLILLCVAAGFFIGMISGVLGIGGGTMLVPLFIYAFKMDIYRAVGTSLAVIAPVSLVGAYSHHLKGHVDLSVILFVTLAAAAGIFAGGQIIHWIPEAALRKAFALFLIAVAVKLILK